MDAIIRDPDQANVTGTIVDALGGPIANVVVTLSRERSDAEPVTTRSADDGTFALDAPPGGAQVCARAEFYSRACNRVIAPSDGNTIVLMPESTITGKVISAMTGQPIAGAAVTARNENGLGAPPSTAVTGRDGTFAIGALPAGGYAVRAVSENARSQREWVALGVADASAPVVLVASPAVRLSATVLVAGEPCPAGHVLLSGPVDAHEQLDEQGSFKVDGLLSGAYEAVIMCSRALPHTEAFDVADEPVEYVWTLEEVPTASETEEEAEERVAGIGATLKISVSHQGEQDARMQVFVQPQLSGPMLMQGRRRGDELIFEDLRAGTYSVYAYDQVEQARQVTIRDGESLDVQLTVAASSSLSGRVIDALELPVPDAWVTYFRSDLPIGEMVAAPPTLTDVDGAFTVRATADAPYTIVVTSPAGDGRLEGARSGQDTTIRVSAPVSQAP